MANERMKLTVTVSLAGEMRGGAFFPDKDLEVECDFTQPSLAQRMLAMGIVSIVDKETAKKLAESVAGSVMTNGEGR